MESERWKQVEELYHSALEQDEARREDFLKKACAGDLELLQEVESLLLHEKQSESFIESRPWRLLRRRSHTRSPLQLANP